MFVLSDPCAERKRWCWQKHGDLGINNQDNCKDLFLNQSNALLKSLAYALANLETKPGEKPLQVHN